MCTCKANVVPRQNRGTIFFRPKFPPAIFVTIRLEPNRFPLTRRARALAIPEHSLAQIPICITLASYHPLQGV